eukprot:TRINITY_DN87_c0_g1_i1.p1 TRINITY_DN87_c0_g1~~TRINITY_DN87_c0_g1_i1.p1  ORF type:complete len:841 (+),score=370.74 TRINITY_DN87_c0_g1_i1:37-2523(+)
MTKINSRVSYLIPLAALLFTLAIHCALMSLAVEADGSLDMDLKGGKSVTDDTVIETEEIRMSAEGYSVAERKAMEEAAETHQFQTEVNKMMNLIINSLYSNKEIFLRELISNASDALDKIRHAALTDPSVLGENGENFEVKIKIDEDNNAIHITDTGIGMTKEELIENLGTIAKSGTKDFIDQLSKGGDVSLIGQFGVGFYSAFLVADRVTVTSKSNDDDTQWVWESTSKSDFSLAADPKGNTLVRGTRITLHIKDDAAKFLESATVRQLVSKYSEFIDYPIRLWVERDETEEVEIEEEDVEEVDAEEKTEDEDDTESVLEVDESDEEEEEEEEKAPKTKTVTTHIAEWEELNTQKPIWTRSKRDITEEEYNSFYKSISKDHQDPLTHVHFNAEGDYDFKSILFVPKKAPQDLYQPQQAAKGVKLYVRRVFITDDFDSVMPKYLAFIKGVIDSADLPLNVSREILQESEVLSIIQKKLTRKAISMIEKLSKDEDAYAIFWEQYSASIKLGVVEDQVNQSKLSKLLRFTSSKTGKLTSLQAYIDGMREGQEDIYFLAGEDLGSLESSPLVERLVKKGYEVLFMTEAIDEYTMQSLTKFEGKKIVNVAKGDLDLGDVDEDVQKEIEEEFKTLTDYLKTALKGKIAKAVITTRLTTTPATITTGQWGWTANMERIFKAQALGGQGQQAQMYKPQKTLEINPRHPIVVELNRRVQADEEDSVALDTANLLFDVAQLGSGFQVEDTADFAQRVQKMVQLSLNLDPDVEIEEEEINELPSAKDVAAAAAAEAEAEAEAEAKADADATDADADAEVDSDADAFVASDDDVMPDEL